VEGSKDEGEDGSVGLAARREEERHRNHDGELARHDRSLKPPRVGREASNEEAVLEYKLDAVERALSAVENVETLHHIHAWALTSGRNLFSAHIGIKDGADAEIVRRAADVILRKSFKFYFTTLQVETSSAHSDPATEINYLWNESGDKKT
jgi:hypothetical protein